VRRLDEPPGGEAEGRQDDGLAITRADMAAYLEEHPAMAGHTGAVLEVAARKARRRRPDLSDDEFATLARQALPNVSLRMESVVDEILTYIQAYRPAPPRAGRPGAPRLSEGECQRQLQSALARLAALGVDWPTRDAIAGELGMDPRSLYRWLRTFPSLRRLLRP
jgi:CRP-like cAMP-binding protein